MSVEQMRDNITNVYKGEKWKTRVSKMGDAQVVALYFKFLKEGKIK